MKLIFLSKRRPQGRDLFIQPYGRFYYLPLELARRGHDVHLHLLSYDRSPIAQRDVEINLHITTHPALSFPWQLNSYYRTLVAYCHQQRPDWIIGCSDLWFGILAVHLARQFNTRVLIDAYDNFESYYPPIPGIRWRWRRALRHATAMTAAGPQLADLLSHSAGGRTAAVLPMVADPEFYPQDRRRCRQYLGLPLTSPLLGYTGALDARRNVAQLFTTYQALLPHYPTLQLVMSGRLAPQIQLPANTIHLGYLPPEQVPLLLNSLDAVFVINRPTAFGHYAYPVKLCEAMRCHIPVIATAVRGTAWMLRHHPHCLVPPDDLTAWVMATRRALQIGRYDYAAVDNDNDHWEDIATQLELLLQSAGV
ncbi:glycosyltransferase [Rhodoferax sp. 4810]|uniref:Glycosyltransferase n=1 Tax=Thiospirillum jenense TaxID=1653858 RepID=A0A839HFY6_9GAMM|nr:glycosyltransferase [Thiospirillum jenense]MBB1073983.1 glycosyltransferase [Rhodoferax jenense]MBB1125859.1 glycosyltransferase [Thiospirillum jenense]